MPRRAPLLILLPLAVALTALYAIEALLTAASPALIDKLGTTLRRGPSVIAETGRMRARGIRAYPFLQPDTFTDSTTVKLAIPGDTAIVPLSGIASELTILCNESGTTVGYRADSLGFRNPNSAWQIRGPDLALIGDSFAQGFCRPERETIGARLRATGRAAVNAGITGAGPLAELGVEREFLTAVRPRRVFWLFYEGNDLIDLASERHTLLRRYLDPDFTQRLRDRRVTVSDAMKRYADSTLAAYMPPGFADRLHGFLTLRQLRIATGIRGGPRTSGIRDERAEAALLQEVLARAKSDVEAWGGTLVLVYLPERRRFNSATAPVVGENHDPREVERAVTRIAAATGIPVINAAAAFAAESNPRGLWNARRYHYNAAGYALVAKLISAEIDP